VKGRVIIHRIYSFSNPREDILHADYTIVNDEGTIHKTNVIMKELKDDIVNNGGMYWVNGKGLRYKKGIGSCLPVAITPRIETHLIELGTIDKYKEELGDYRYKLVKRLRTTFNRYKYMGVEVLR